MKCPLQGKNFYCREWTFAKIAHYLNNSSPGSSSWNSGILIVGGPGSGKTALCCELVWPSTVISPQAELNARVVAHHFCQRFDTASLEPVGFICSIASQLTHSPLIPDFGEKVRAEKNIESWLDPARCKLFPKDSFKAAVLDPLSTVLPPQETLILLIDSLHEIFDHSTSLLNGNNRNKDEVTVLDLVSEAIAYLPPWLVLLCTSRRGCRPVTQRLAGFKKITLDDLRRSYAVRDIQQYILARLDGEDSLRVQLDSETAEMLNQLHIKSAGCFLYLELVLDGVRDGFIRLREIQHMPGTLNGLYLWLCQRIFARGKNYGKIRAILDILLAVREPLTTGELQEIVMNRNRSKREFQEMMETLGDLLLEIELYKQQEQTSAINCPSAESPRRKTCVIIFHPSFSEWLLDVKYCTRKYLCDPSEGHACLALWYASRGQDLTSEEIVCFAYHLTKCPTRLPFSSTPHPLWLIESGAAVQDLVLNCPVINEATTRLLLEAGADFVNLGENTDKINLNNNTPDLLEMGRSPDSENSSVRSESEILADESLVDGEGRTLLHQVSNEGRVSTVRRLLARGAYCDPEDRHGDTPLCLAAKQGHFGAVQSLLQSGADVNHIGHEGWTPLRCAAWGGHLETVEILLKYGATVDFCGGDKRTPLRAAAWSGNMAVVSCLLRSGAGVDEADPEGRTALMASAYMGHRDIVTLLLQWGANPNHADVDGRTALNVSAVCASPGADHVAVAECLVSGGANIDCQDKVGRTPLFTAALEGHFGICELLVGLGADLDLPDNLGNSPLHVAASCGHGAIVRLLLDQGADADNIDCEGRTVLSVAAAQGNEEIVADLLDRSLDEMHKDNNGWIPLHHAAFEGNSGACRLLCERCLLSVEQSDREGRHPLILAAEEGHEETVKALVDFNAPINQPTLDGCTAFRLSALNGHRRVCEVLVSYGADIDTRDIDGTSTLYALILQRSLEMAQYILGMGCRTNVADSQGRVALHVAAWLGDSLAVDLLLRYGADIDARDSEGRTPLMIALWRNQIQVVKILLERKADVLAVCLQGATALSIACQEGHEESVKLLLQYGADLEHQDAYGRTAVDVAAKAGHTKIVQLMDRLQSLSPRSPRRLLVSPTATNTAHSGGSSLNSADKTSGFVSLICSSSDSHSARNPICPNTSSGWTNVAGVFRPNVSYSTQSSSDHYATSGSNKSTVSSCGTPEDDFAQQLLERSLPRPHSRPVSMRLCLSELPALNIPGGENFGHQSLCHSNQPNLIKSTSGKQRPKIATNPKCRKPKKTVSHSQIVDTRTERADLRDTTAKLQNLMRISSAGYREEHVSVL